MLNSAFNASGHEVEQRLFLILLQLSVIILVARLFAGLFRRFKQPMAAGEIAAGLVLGPSLLGWMFPQLFALIFPSDSVPMGHDVGQVLRVISQIGLVFLLFLIGLDFACLFYLYRASHKCWTAVRHTPLAIRGSGFVCRDRRKIRWVRACGFLERLSAQRSAVHRHDDEYASSDGADCH